MGFIVFGRPIFYRNQDDSSLYVSAMNYFVSYLLLWTLPSGVMPLGDRNAGYPVRDSQTHWEAGWSQG